MMIRGGLRGWGSAGQSQDHRRACRGTLGKVLFRGPSIFQDDQDTEQALPSQPPLICRTTCHRGGVVRTAHVIVSRRRETAMLWELTSISDARHVGLPRECRRTASRFPYPNAQRVGNPAPTHQTVARPKATIDNNPLHWASRTSNSISRDDGVF